jgi:hypothetical protein
LEAGVPGRLAKVGILPPRSVDTLASGVDSIAMRSLKAWIESVEPRRLNP